MTYRKSVIILFSALAVFIVSNLIIWKLFTEKLLTSRYGTGGDLARLGYIIDSKQLRRAVVDLPKRHIEFKDYNGQPVDMIVIGDSFSNGGGEGKNSYYQDYIATYNNFTVLNITMYKQGPAETVMYLFNSGLLDKIQPRYLLMQSVERYCSERFSGKIDLNLTEDLHKLEAHYKEVTDSFNYLPKLSFMNDGNVKYLYYRLMYLFSDSPTNQVIARKLSRPFFDVKNDNLLLFYKDDIKNIPRQNREAVVSLNNNINRLSELLSKRGIKLYFMPSVDKYNLYSEFIVDNPYPRSVFFEELRPLPKNYGFIDTKQILLEVVQRGEKDIYYADDTHWSWRASELIFKNVSFSSAK